jgi:hypothetical protein
MSVSPSVRPSVGPQLASRLVRRVLRDYGLGDPLVQLIVSTENEMLQMLIVIVPVKVKVNFDTIHCEFHDQGDNVKR